MSSRLTRFVTRHGTYTFQYLTQYQDNFGELVPQTTRMPGSDGGFDAYGDLSPPKQIGAVQAQMSLYAANETIATQLTDALSELVSWGVGRLYQAPTDPNQAERWCWAKLTSAPHSINNAQHEDYLRSLRLSFQVTDPHWYSQGTWPWQWGDGTKWNSKRWGGGAVPQRCTGLQTDFEIVRAGTATTYPSIVIQSQGLSSIYIQRLAGSTVLDEVRYTRDLPAGTRLTINAFSWSVDLDGDDAYDEHFDANRLHWLILPTGRSQMRVVMGNPSDQCTVTIRYYEAWNA